MNAQLQPLLDTRPVFARETSATVMQEIGQLIEQHYHEVTHHPDIPVGCDYAKYQKLEAAGVLRIYTVRVAGDLVGYAIFTVAMSLHYCTSLQARQDTLFLSKPFRRGSTGYRFLRWVDEQLTAEGVQYAYHHGKLMKDIQPIFTRLGYEPIYYVFGRRLNPMNLPWMPRLYFARGIDEALLAEIVVDGSAAEGTSAGAVAAGAGAAAAGAAGGAAAAGAFSGGSGATTNAATSGQTSVTGPNTSAGSGGTTSTQNSPNGMWGNLGKAALTSAAGSVASYGLNAAFGQGRGGVSIPPPPGTAMINQEGAQAAAQVRQRQAAAGGINSTATGAGAGPGGNASYSSATSGGKSLLGQ